MNRVFEKGRAARSPADGDASRVRLVVRKKHLAARLAVEVARSQMVLEGNSLYQLRLGVVGHNAHVAVARWARFYNRLRRGRIVPGPGVSEPQVRDYVNRRL